MSKQPLYLIFTINDDGTETPTDTINNAGITAHMIDCHATYGQAAIAREIASVIVNDRVLNKRRITRAATARDEERKEDARGAKTNRDRKRWLDGIDRDRRGRAAAAKKLRAIRRASKRKATEIVS